MENGERAELAEWFFFSSSLGWSHPHCRLKYNRERDLSSPPRALCQLARFGCVSVWLKLPPFVVAFRGRGARFYESKKRLPQRSRIVWMNGERGLGSSKDERFRLVITRVIKPNQILSSSSRCIFESCNPSHYTYVDLLSCH